MFVVPNDTQLLIFNLPIDAGMCSEQIKRLEKDLTEQTGIRCVVYDAVFCPVKNPDFEVRWMQLNPTEKPVGQSEPALKENPQKEGNNGKRKPSLGDVKTALCTVYPFFLRGWLCFLQSLGSFTLGVCLLYLLRLLRG